MMSVMNRKIYLIVLKGFLCMALLMSPARADTQFVEDYFNSLYTLTANFDQTSVPVDEAKDSNGTLFLKKSKGFRFNYLTPFKQEVVSNLEKVWIYDQDLEQVTERKIDTDGSNNPLQFLISASPITESFTVSKGSNENHYRLNPKTRNSEMDIEAIDLFFKNNNLQRIEIINATANKTIFTLSEAKGNIPVSDELFDFSAPDGVDVIVE